MRRKLLNNRYFQIFMCCITAIIFGIVTVYIPDEIEKRQLRKESAERERLIQEETEHLMQSSIQKHDTDQIHLEQTDQNTTRSIYSSDLEVNNSMIENIEPIAVGNEKSSSEKRYTSGIYKGMTYKEAMEQWEVRKSAVTKRLLASTNRSLELGDAQLKSSRDERSTILSFFKHMPIDQLESAKQEALEIAPDKSESINTFFNDLANHGGGKSLEETVEDAESILTDRQVWRIAFNQNNAVFDQIKQDLAEVNKDKPTQL